jgi:DNA helicase-2/ATP-dependent DNA helicase PcrA
MTKYFNYNKDVIISNIITNGAKKLALALQYDEKVKSEAINNINISDIDIHKKFELRRKVESGNVAYLKNVKENFKIFKIYEDFIKNIDKFSDYENIDILKKQTLDNLKKKTLGYDDLAGILYLYARFVDFPYYRKLKVVFVDEAQDLSSLMYLAFTKLFSNATFSIFGDVAQGIYSYQAIDSWEDVLRVINNSSLMYLKRSYRTTIEIMEDANKTLTKLGFMPANNVIRHGETVDYVNDNSLLSIQKQLNELKKNYSKTAIICKDEKELKEACEKLSTLNLVVLDENNISYDNNDNVILTIQTSKGLEFDSVIIYNEKAFTDNPNDLKLLYVAKTRALHKLIIDNCK